MDSTIAFYKVANRPVKLWEISEQQKKALLSVKKLLINPLVSVYI
mgnify:CR=1